MDIPKIHTLDNYITFFGSQLSSITLPQSVVDTRQPLHFTQSQVETLISQEVVPQIDPYLSRGAIVPAGDISNIIQDFQKQVESDTLSQMSSNLALSPNYSLKDFGITDAPVSDIHRSSLPVTVNTVLPSTVPITNIPVNSNVETLTDTQFTRIEKQLSLLTQAVTHLTELVKKSHKTKIVEPKIFKYEDDHDLEQFFVQFEKYCSLHYPHAHDQWLRLLEKYLTGSFLKLYIIIERTVTTYSEAKETLLKWFHHEEKIKNENKVQDYYSAYRFPEEKIYMFALRFEQLANKAFGVNMKEHFAFRTAFLLSLPFRVESELREYIRQNEIHTGRKVPFDRLVVLADYYDRESTSPNNGNFLRNPNDITKKKTARNKIRNQAEEVPQSSPSKCVRKISGTGLFPQADIRAYICEGVDIFLPFHCNKEQELNLLRIMENVIQDEIEAVQRRQK